MSDLFTPQDDQPADPLKDLAKKFGDGENIDVQKLAVAKVESDRFIAQLTREQAELRAELQKRETAEAIMTKIREASATPAQQPPVTPPAQAPQGDLKETISKMLEEEKKKDRLEKNKSVVSQKLQEAFGNEANLQLNRIARELGVSLDYLAQLSQESPAVFFKTIGLDKKVQPANVVAPPAGTSPTQVPVNTDGAKTLSYYQKLRKTNPAEYFKPSVQNQMHKDGMKLGEAFFDA